MTVDEQACACLRGVGDRRGIYRVSPAMRGSGGRKSKDGTWCSRAHLVRQSFESAPTLSGNFQEPGLFWLELDRFNSRLRPWLLHLYTKYLLVISRQARAVKMRLRNLLALTVLQAAHAAAQEGEDFLDYADPLIGTVDGGKKSRNATGVRKGANIYS